MVPPPVSRVLFTIAFDGSRYAGWQRQSGVETVQEHVERALQAVYGQPVAVEGSGRTDAGVHAIAMAAHADLPRQLATGSVLMAINTNLPDDIAVRSVRAVPADFHARFHARGKRYVYRIAVSRTRPAIARSYYHWVRRPLDLARMREAVAHLVGRHDFASFATNPGYERKRGTVRTIHHLHLVQRPWGIDLAVQGDGFLYNMVRAIAGTLVDVGGGRLTPSDVKRILDACDRSEAGPTAPAAGLYLLRVLYDPCVIPADVASRASWMFRGTSAAEPPDSNEPT